MNSISRLTRTVAILLALLIVSAAEAQKFAPAPVEVPADVPVHVMLFALHADGVVQPDLWRAGVWLDFHPATDEEIDEAVRESDAVRQERMSGRIGVRALDASGSVIYQTIVDVALFERIGGEGDTPAWNRPIENPLFLVAVPREATLLRFEGWQPATRASFSTSDIAARYRHDRISASSVQGGRPNQVGTILNTVPNRVNILILGDGYTANDQALFDTHVANVIARLYITEPYKRYSQYFAVQSAFQVSAVSGAYHPAQCPAPPGTTLANLQQQASMHNTLMHSFYCGNAVDVRNLAVDFNDVFRQRALAMNNEPDIVVVLVNDPQYGGSGGRYVTASADPWAPFIAIHEIAHKPEYTGLADEYSSNVGSAVCSEPNCQWNVTTQYDSLNRSRSSLKWSRWVDSDPVPTCTADQGTCQANHPQVCTTRAVGAYEGAQYNCTRIWRSEYNCIMRNNWSDPSTSIFDQPGFCHLCTEKHVRAIYQRVDPVIGVFEPARLSTSATRAPAVHVGQPVDLGLQMLEPSTDPKFNFKWTVDGTVVDDDHGATFRYVPATATTHRVEVEYDDPTALLRTDAANAKPRLMHGTRTWNIKVDAAPSVTSFGTAPVVNTATLTVPQGTQFLDFNYTLATAEPGTGSRPGDQWSVTVSYTGATATSLGLTAAEPLFHADGTILGPAENGTRIAPSIPIATSSGPVSVVVEVSVRNLETSDFIPTTVSASLSALPVSCGSQCDYCAAHPDDPSCPVGIAINSATVIPNAGVGDRSYFSLGERLDSGWHVSLRMKLPASYKRLRMTAVAIRPRDNAALMIVRDTSSDSSLGAMLGFNKTGSDTYDFNLSPKKDFAGDGAHLVQLPESEWTHELKFKITATVTMFDDRVGSSSIDVDTIISSLGPDDPVTIPRPLHALWHSSKSGARWHYWSSMAFDNLLRTALNPYTLIDRIADEHGVEDTPYGHQYGTGLTEPQFFPGAGRYDYGDYSHYGDFRKDAQAALDGAPGVTAAQQQAARDLLVTWVGDLRAHLEKVLADNFVGEVRVGDGGWCSTAQRQAGDRLPDDWMKTLLLGGRIVDANGNVLLDVASRVGADWQPVNLQHLSFACEENFHINVLIDRCRIGEVRGPCTTGRPPGRRVTIRQAPVSQSINSGDGALLSVIADGTDLHYQWYTGPIYTYSSPIPGASGSTISVTPTESTTYWVLVSGAEGVAGAAATITVTGSGGPCTAPPAITTQPAADIGILAGQSALLSVSATGDGLHYQWKTRDLFGGGVPFAGATGSTFRVYDQGVYFVTVSNACGSLDSTTTTVYFGTNCITPGPNTLTASSTSVTLGDSVTLSIAPVGTMPIQITWYEGHPDGTNRIFAGGTSVDVTPAEDQTSYLAALSNSCGSMFTQPVTIRVCTPPVITRQPVAPVFQFFGQSAELSVEATGSDLHYTWFAGGAQLSDDSPAILIGAPPGSVDYYCLVSNDCGNVQSNHVVVNSPCSPPVITTQPVSGTVVRGNGIPLSVAAGGTPLFSYQWYVKAPGDTSYTPVPNSSSASISVSPAIDQTRYLARVTNACGAVDSNPATITVTNPCAPPQVTSSPQSQVVAAGSSVTLTAAATGSTPMSIVWSTLLPGNSDWTTLVAGVSSITFTANTSGVAYRATFSNACGSATTLPAVITIACTPPEITTPPASQSIAPGDQIVLSVTAAGSDPLSYQWFTVEGGQAIAINSATDAQLAVTPSATTVYRVAVNNACGTATADATLTIVSCTLPQITQQPQPSTITAGESATLSVSATGGPLTVSWFTLGGTAAGSGLSIGVSPASTTSYYARVSNSCGTVQSALVTVTVSAACTPPSVVTNPQGTTVVSGTQVTLSALGAGTALTYEWYDEFDALLGRGATVTFTPAVTRSYYCTIANSCGSVRTSLALVTVTPACNAPVITGDPLSKTITAGESALLSAFAAGANVTLQWYLATGEAIPDAHGNSITVSPMTTTSYYMVATNECGSARSATATVTVLPPP